MFEVTVAKKFIERLLLGGRWIGGLETGKKF